MTELELTTPATNLTIWSVNTLAIFVTPSKFNLSKSLHLFKEIISQFPLSLSTHTHVYVYVCNDVGEWNYTDPFVLILNFLIPLSFSPQLSLPHCFLILNYLIPSPYNVRVLLSTRSLSLSLSVPSVILQQQLSLIQLPFNSVSLFVA